MTINNFSTRFGYIIVLLPFGSDYVHVPSSETIVSLNHGNYMDNTSCTALYERTYNINDNTKTCNGHTPSELSDSAPLPRGASLTLGFELTPCTAPVFLTCDRLF